MSLYEEIGQLNLRGASSRVKGTLPETHKKAVREGRVGAFLSVMNKDYVKALEKVQNVVFEISTEDFKFVSKEMAYVIEPLNLMCL